MKSQLVLRPARPEDEPLLREVYASTRTEELAVLPWDEPQKSAFLRMQFDTQHRYYRDQFRSASFDVIMYDDRPIGRLYVDRKVDLLHILDIALLPAHRGHGIGGRLLRSLLDEAEQASLPVRIHVEKSNPALRLYRRLGFTAVGESGMYLRMEWNPNGERVG